MSAHHKKVITQLQAHDVRSLQFFNIAARYFRRRLRVVWSCSIFFFFMAPLSVLLSFISTTSWWERVFTILITFYMVYLCWFPFRVGLHGMRMIDAARRLDQRHQLDCLEFLATNLGTYKNMQYLWGADPIAVYVLTALRHTKPAA